MAQTIKVYQQFPNKKLRNFIWSPDHLDVRSTMQHLDPVGIGFTDLAEQRRSIRGAPCMACRDDALTGARRSSMKLIEVARGRSSFVCGRREMPDRLMLLAYPSPRKHPPIPNGGSSPCATKHLPDANSTALFGALLSCSFNTLIEKKWAACLALRPLEVIVSVNSLTFIRASF
jgi:hypothetical protein